MAVNRNKVQEQADKLVAAGKLDAAVDAYRKLVADNPRDLGTLNKIGDLYARLNKRPDAIATYTRIAEIYAEDGFFLKAIAIYKKITKIDPSNIDILTRLAELYSRQGLKTEARAQFVAVAQAHLKRGTPRDAIPAYEALAAMEPEIIQHRLALAELQAKCGMRAEAATTLLALGLELERKGSTKESAKIYELAFKTSQGEPDVAYRLATALIGSGQHEKALQVAEKVLATHPDSAPLLEARGVALQALGRDGEAESALKAALDADPERAGAIIGLGTILANRGSLEEASSALSDGMEIITGGGKGREAGALLDSILEANSTFKPALEVLYRLNSMLGDRTATVVAGRRLIEASVAEKHFAEALAVARRLVELEPGVPEHVERVSRIQRLAEGKTVPESPDGEVALGHPLGPVASSVEDDVEVEEIASDHEEEFDIEEEPAGAPEPPAHVPVDHALTSEDDEFIAERLTEADVFVKYGLADRAIEQLASIVTKFPWHVSTRQRLRDLYLEEGNRARAAVEAAELGKVMLQDGDRAGAGAALEEARSIDAACPSIPELEALLSGRPAPQAVTGGAAPSEAAEDEEESFVIDEGSPEPVEEAVGDEGDSVPMAAAPAETPSPGAEEDPFDLAAELDASFFGTGAGITGEEEALVSELEATPEGHSLDEIVSAFRKGIEQQVGAEDFETHYNLGIAYKEMGLVDEAIAEFQFAAKSPTLMASCCSMLGMCFREKGMQGIAVKWYRKGLDALAGGGDEEQINGLRYDLAEILEQMGEYQQARDLLTEVYGMNSRYRDVADRMKALEERING